MLRLYPPLPPVPLTLSPVLTSPLRSPVRPPPPTVSRESDRRPSARPAALQFGQCDNELKIGFPLSLFTALVKSIPILNTSRQIPYYEQLL